MLNVPSYNLNDINIFNFRQHEWSEDKIINVATEMLSCGESDNIRIKTIEIVDKEKNDLSEIKRTRSKLLNIDLEYQKDDEKEEINLSYDIPWLANNHFFIGSNHKVCIYQLFDRPVIKRKDMIKIRTNIQSITVIQKTSTRRKYNYQLKLFGKKMPFARLVIAYYGVDGVRSKFNINENNEYQGSEINDKINCLISDIISILDNQTIDKTKLLETFFPRRTDKKILDDLQLMLDVDIFTMRYFHTNSIIEEFLYALENEIYDDSNYYNKRIRFAEQIIYIHLCKDFYNLINSVRKNRRIKFSINSKNILSSVNVSDIVQFDNSLNPLSELSLLSRTSLGGPGGFEKQNVPSNLREIHPSMKSLIDPSDTADREGCGTIQYFVPNVIIDDNGSFYSPNNEKINSVAVSFVPFLEHDDATRLQMASSQQRHAIMLKEFDIPMVQSGVEGMFSDETSFLFRAKRDGTIIYLDDQIILIQYDNNRCEAFYIGFRKLYISTIDFYKIYYNVGDSFRKNDIIAETNYMENGRITLGRNCLACIMPWYGYNFEDGIVISDKMVEEDYFTSVHYKDLVLELNPNKVLLNLNDDYSQYKPIPKVGDILQKGEVYAKIKSIDTNGFDDVIFEPIQEKKSPENCKITNVKVYANKWNKSFPQYDNFIQNSITDRREERNKLISVLSNHLTKTNLDNLLDTLEINQSEKNNYKIKGNYIDGLRIELTVVFERKISIGDKIGNRHGNKGVISRIVPHEQMPKLPDGRHAEIIVNPLGITSRMNVGQVFEAHLTMSFNDLKNHIREMYENKKSKDEIYKYIIDYIKIIDRTANKNYTIQMQEILDNVSLDDFVRDLDNLFIIQPPFESVQWDQLDKALKYTNTQYEYSTFEPISEQFIQEEIAWGFMYWFKLNHIAQDKISARGIGPYSAKTSQPLGGKTRKGGQRLGEMEIWATIAHGAEKNLDEFISTKSDSVKLRNQYISQQMCNSDLLLDSDDDSVPQSLRLLQTNLKSIGLDYELNDNIDYDDEQETGDTEENASRKILGEDSRGETVEIPQNFEIGSPDWGDEKIVYNVSNPDYIPDKNKEKGK